MEHFVQFEDVSKYYQTGSVRIAAADHLNFYVDKGEEYFDIPIRKKPGAK